MREHLSSNREDPSIEGKWGPLVAEIPAFARVSGVQFRLELIRSVRGFEKLLEGFERVRAVTYVAEARSVLDFFEKFGCSDVEIVLGESFTDVQSTMDPQVLERLCAKVGDGTLRIFVPKKTIHSKMYILEKPGLVRVVYGSRNLYPTGSWDSVAVFDLGEGDAIAREFV